MHLRPIGACLGHQLLNQRGVIAQILLAAAPLFLAGIPQVVEHPDGQSPITSAASVYGLYAPSSDATRPVGEWNTARIVLRGNHVEHWLNDEKVASFEIGFPDWKTRIVGTKFADWPALGTLPAGHIVLQDHGDPVEYRNFMVRTLPD